MKRNWLVVVVAATLALAACKTDLSAINDAQLLSLLGNTPQAFISSNADSAPPQITARMQECITLLSGVNAVLYKDFPEEMAGIIKTDCRKDLDLRLRDPSRNSTDLALDDFERGDLAERIFSIASTQKMALANWRGRERAIEEARQEQEMAEQGARQIEQDNEVRAKITTQIAARIREVEVLLAAVQERRTRIISFCETLLSLHNDLTSERDDMSSGQKNRLVILMNPLDADCKIRNARGPFDPEKILTYELDQTGRSLASLQEFVMPQHNIPSYTRIPNIFDPDLAKIDRRILRIEEGIEGHNTLKDEL